MSDSIVNLGIVGCGKATQRVHLPALARVPELRVVALCDVAEAALATVAPNRGARRLTDWRALVALPEVDAVAVVTPPGSHAEIGCAVLRAGKHLFLDKPLAASQADGQRLVAAGADSRGKVLMGFNYRWHRLVRQGRELVRSGALGSLRAIRSVYTHRHSGLGAPTWHQTRALGGGVLINDGVHHFDMWRFLLDRDIEEIKLHSTDSPQCEDDTCTLSARLTGGVLGSALFSLSSGPESAIEIFGEAGRLQLSLYQFDGLQFIPATAFTGGLGLRVRAASRTLGLLPAALRGLRGQGDTAAAAVAMWRHFADCILRDEPPACSLCDGQQAMAALLAASRSTL